MSPITLSLIAAVFLASVGVAGDIALRIAGAEPTIHWKFFMLGTSLYASTAIGWFFIMKHLKFATIGIYFGISSLLLLSLVGHFYFKENLNPYEFLGIGLGIVSMILLGKYA